MSVHVGVKYQCNQCDFKFTKQGNLKRHKISVHGGYLKLHKMSLFWISLLIQKRSFREELKKPIHPTPYGVNVNICGYFKPIHKNRAKK